MATISSQDRARLTMVLEKQIPTIQDKAQLNLFCLMLTLLRDYKELEATALHLTHITLNEAAKMKKLYLQLLQQACPTELESDCGNDVTSQSEHEIKTIQ